MTTLVDGVSFNAVSGGTGTFVFSSPRASFRTLAQAVADGSLSDGQTVSYLAQDSLNNPKQREWGHGTYSASGNSVARTTVLGGIDNGSDTGTSPVSFSHPPVVSLTALAEDLGGGGRTQLSGATTYYVRATGSDSNAGTLGHPWLTPQHAVNFIADNIDGGGMPVTVDIGAGTFVGVDLLPTVGLEHLYLRGAGSGSTVLTAAASGQGAISAANIVIGCSVFYTGFNLHCADAQSCVRLGLNNQLWGVDPAFTTSDVVYTAAPSNPGFCVWVVTESFWSDGEGVGTATIGSGSWQAAFKIEGPANAQIGDAYTVSGTPSFSTAFMYAPGGTPTCYGSFTGAATGKRFDVITGGNVQGSSPGALGLNFFPGSIAGTGDASSFYDGFPFQQKTSGSPANLPVGSYAINKDTTQATGFGNALYVNDNGTILNLTPKFFLNSNTTFYVSTTGSDSNSGLDSLHPWRTLQHAVDTLSNNVDANGFSITVQIADGTYVGFQINGVPQGIGAYYQFLGNITTPGNVIINTSSSLGCVDVVCVGQAIFQLGGLTLQPAANKAGLVLSADYNFVYLAKVVFDGTNVCGDAIGIYSNFCDVQVGYDVSGSLGGGVVGCTWKGSWTNGINVDGESAASVIGTQTLTSTPSFGTAFVNAQAPGATVNQGGASFSGSATGVRFNVKNGTILADGSGNLNFYPGSSAGTVTDGIYDNLIYALGTNPPTGQVATYTATLPTTVTSSGQQFQYTFDGSGNLYFCYQVNTWAKYTNAAPFDNSGGGQSEPIPVIFG